MRRELCSKRSISCKKSRLRTICLNGADGRRSFNGRQNQTTSPKMNSIVSPIRSLFRQTSTFIFEIRDDAVRAPLYDAAASIVSRDRCLKVAWYHARGRQTRHDATLVVAPTPANHGPRPCREVVVVGVPAGMAIEHIRRAMKSCIDEASENEA